MGRLEGRNLRLSAARRPSVCAGAVGARWLSLGIAKRIFERALGQQEGKGQLWHGGVAKGRHQRQEQEAGAERGESTRLSEGWELKEQKRQMKKRIRRACREERNQGKAVRRKRKQKINVNRSTNKAKRRWYRLQARGFQPSAELGAVQSRTPRPGMGCVLRCQ